MELDSIKSRARHASWKSDADSKWDRYNPFMRKHSRTTDTRDAGDLESQIQQRPDGPREMHSTGCIDTNTTQSIPPPAHANTFHSGSPTSSTGTPVDGNLNGSAKDYYSQDNNESQATTIGGDDNISRLRGKTGTNLAPVTEKSESANEKTSSEGDDDDYEERKKRKHDEMMKKKIPAMQQLRTVLFPQWLTINWLLIAAPVGIALNYVKVNPLAIFIVNFVAIIPLAGILSFATEEIALRVGEVLGGLLNASFG
jgi:Ca2+:H+ antiporter